VELGPLVNLVRLERWEALAPLGLLEAQVPLVSLELQGELVLQDN
jgi:hypothetical protein